MPSAIVHTNLIDADATLTASSTDANWPLENLWDQIAAKVFRWAAAASGTSILILADDANPPVTGRATPSLAASSIWANLGTISARYLKLQVDGNWMQVDFGSSISFDTVAVINHNWPSGASVGQFGQLVIGSRTELPRAYRYGKMAGRERGEVYKETVGGVSFVSHLHTREVRDYMWRVLESELATFQALDAAIRGRTYPYVFIPDTSSAEVLYVRNAEGGFAPQEHDRPSIETGGAIGNVYDIAVRMRQESFGLDLVPE